MNHDWEFMEMILRELPSNIFFKDTECRYLFATHYWRHIKHDEEEEWSIKGKTDLEIRKDKENAQLAYEQDKKILATGKGCQYTIEINLEGKTEYLEIIKNPVRNKEGKIIGIVGLINDVTDRMKLQKQLEVYAQTDIMTGLYNRRYLEYWRKSVLSPDMFPLSIISADCDGLKYMNDVYGHAVGDELK
ncbi:MAG: diguanylate cyclase, partial [Ruminococcus sp.]